ncbi:hypothetical protein Pmani_034063 [Petrolisthes manimaculis]|uniref:Uncharacterized protein n=1 Tax=Petrolisthes manimaculis TaxID=1843537 RepID=A0AAE1NQC1_9EUCA|nr:hypothetical protein Pmani_034063 [Petrolisthes manimaculis]
MSKGSEGIVVEALPRVCLHDVPTNIMVSGCPPSTPVTITMDTHNDEGKKFNTHAHFVCDDNGSVDVSHSESVGGSYTGIFPAGLFSTLKEFPFKGTRLQKLDPTKPWKMEVRVYKGHVSLEECDAETVKEVASTTLVRFVMAPGVKRIMVREGRVRGALFLPQGTGPFPAVIDVFGGFGGLREYRAAILASRGFACLALAYFKFEDLPETMDKLELDYFEEAVEIVLAQPEVIPDRCAVVSSSKGSDVALAMAIYLDKVKAVVTIGGVLAKMGTTLMYKGHQLWQGTSMKSIMTIDWKLRFIQRESAVREMYRPDNSLMVPCETAPLDTYFLFIAGDQDTTHSKYGVEGMAQRLKAHGREAQCRTIIYPRAGHIIEPPFNTSSDHSTYTIPDNKGLLLWIVKWFIKEFVIYWGGEPQATCDAQVDYWHQVQKFLNLHARDSSAWYQQHLQSSLTNNLQ